MGESEKVIVTSSSRPGASASPEVTSFTGSAGSGGLGGSITSSGVRNDAAIVICRVSGSGRTVHTRRDHSCILAGEVGNRDSSVWVESRPAT